MIIGSQYTELAADPSDDFLCPKRLPARGYPFSRKPPLLRYAPPARRVYRYTQANIGHLPDF